MKSILIDPKNQAIKEVEYNGNFKHIYKLIDADTFDIARLYDNGEGAYIDDEGLFKEKQYFWIHRNFPTPLAGAGLLLGADEDGNDKQPETSIEKLTHDVKWVGDKHDVACLFRFTARGCDDFRHIYFNEA